jgi:signal transduction histidine kinase
MTAADERLAILAHEVRSPVAALGALAAVAREAPAGGLMPIVWLATAAGRDIARLLSDLDALSLRPEEIDLGGLVRSVVRPGVTCDADTTRVFCDPTRIRQVLANLVANGLRHGTTVTVTARWHEDRIVVEVTDDGSGVPTGIDVFDRGVSGVGSSGYGLWLARAIAEAHGGTLSLSAASAGGTTFTLVVPSPPDASD